MQSARAHRTSLLGCLLLLTSACDCSVPRYGGAPGDVADAGELDGAESDAAPSLARFEICNNGIDDDQNGVLDDGCVCAPGATESCYTGWPGHAGVGACSLGVQRCAPAGPTGNWDSCVGAVLPSTETCDDGIDDDCDGLFDEGCPCEEGATRSCFPGAQGQLAVGPCAAGVTTCVEQATFEGGPTLGWGPCEGAVAPTEETCNQIDDDCDGTADDIEETCDFTDNDCDGEIDEGDACGALPAAFALTRFWPQTGSGILPTRAGLFSAQAVAPEMATCGEDEVLLVEESDTLRCVPSPPTDCTPGTHYDWIGDAWECISCELLVQFGYLFSFERTCAPEPRISCPDGEVPTFTEDERIWRCIPTCDNTDYDHAYFQGRLVCIPC